MPQTRDDAARTDMLRFITCGSVDDGKSTLIGRLLYDSKQVAEDHIDTLSTADGAPDYSRLLDGLEAEREQGITIDVAYRFFNSPARKFIVADTPGHEQYTRNMVTGASTADLAIILVDARKGILNQTRRHTCITALMGIRHAVLAVNKMDLIGFDQARFDAIADEFADMAAPLGFQSLQAIPISARNGDNVFARSTSMGWYCGPSLMEQLDQVDAIRAAAAEKPLRFPVQWVGRGLADTRTYSGTLAAGSIRPGDPVLIAHSGVSAVIEDVFTSDASLDCAIAGNAVTVKLDRECDIRRGDLLCTPSDRPEVADQFEADLIWMGEAAMLPGRSYLLHMRGRTVPVTITRLKHKMDVATLTEAPARTLDPNDIGRATISTTEAVAFDSYDACRETGSFILIDRYSNETVAAGMMRFALRRASNVHPQAMTVDRALRSTMKAQTPVALWFTGLSGAGKSTIADLVETRLAQSGKHTYALDGDNLRSGLNRDLGFTDADRVENLRRVSEVAKLMVDAGLIVTCTFISPFISERQKAREIIGGEHFLEIFVDASLERCIERDPKGLYRKALDGKIKNFTGFDSPYEAPDAPDIRLDTDTLSAEAAADQVIEILRTRGFIS
jgi:bifunctional enzyme CysN/CysC